MSETKIELQVGDINFSCSGEQNWVDDKIEMIFKKLPEIIELSGSIVKPQAKVIHKANIIQNKNETANIDDSYNPFKKFVGNKNLAILLKESSTKKVDVFLITAIWLHAQGIDTIKTGDVIKALQEAHQNRLGNASDCLSKNVKKGFCEKKSDGFIVTVQGVNYLTNG